MFCSKAAGGGGGGGGDSGGGGPTADARAGEGRQMNLQENRAKGTGGSGALDEATRQMRGRNMKKATGAQIAKGKKIGSKLKENRKSDATKQQQQRKAALTKQQQRNQSVSEASQTLRIHTNAVSLFERLQLFTRAFRPLAKLIFHNLVGDLCVKTALKLDEVVGLLKTSRPWL